MRYAFDKLTAVAQQQDAISKSLEGLQHEGGRCAKQ